MQVSKISKEAVKKYLGATSSDVDDIIDIVMSSAVSFIVGYTGLSADELDAYEDISMAFLVICNDMYSNRDFVVDNNSLNPTAKQILDLHCTNFLASEVV